MTDLVILIFIKAGTALLGVMAVVWMLGRRLSAARRCALWYMTFLGMLALPFLTFVLPAWPMIEIPDSWMTDGGNRWPAAQPEIPLAGGVKNLATDGSNRGLSSEEASPVSGRYSGVELAAGREQTERLI